MSFYEASKLAREGKFDAAKEAADKLTGKERTEARALVAKFKSLSNKTNETSALGDAFAKSAKGVTGYIGAMITTLDTMNVSLGKSNAAFLQNQKALDTVALQMMRVSAANAELGFTVNEVTTQYNAFQRTLSMRVRPEFQKSGMALTQQALIWSRLGVGIGTTTGMIEMFDTTLGQGRGEIVKTGRVLTAFAATTGQDVNKVFADFTTNAVKFHDILDSKEMTRQTMLFSLRARSMGTSVTSLMNTMNKFENLDSAQATGAKMNMTISALGGSFDAVKASMMDYPERMEYIARTVQSVAPRIANAGPRASRLYMRSLAKSMDMSPTDLRKMMTWKPGQPLPGEAALRGGGLPTGVTAGAERAMARRGTTIGAMGLAAKDYMNFAPVRAAGAAGASATGMVAGVKGGVQVGGQAILNKVDSTVAIYAKKIGEAFVNTGVTKKFGEFTGKIEAAMKKQGEINAEFANQLVEFKNQKAL